MTLPDDPVDTEAPVEDVLEQRQELDERPAVAGSDPPIEADPADVADQQAVVELDDPDEYAG